MKEEDRNRKSTRDGNDDEVQSTYTHVTLTLTRHLQINPKTGFRKLFVFKVQYDNNFGRFIVSFASCPIPYSCGATKKTELSAWITGMQY